MADLIIPYEFTAGTDAIADEVNGNFTEIETYVNALNATVEAKAPIASPTFTGTVIITTPTAGDNSTKAASTAFVTTAMAGKAPTADPTFTGTVTIPTPSGGDSSTKAASTAFVANAVSGIQSTANAFTGYQRFDAGIFYKYLALSDTAINPTLASYFSKTVTGNITFTDSNTPAAPRVTVFWLILTNGGAHTVQFGFSPKWAGGVQPTFTTAGVDILKFTVVNGVYYGKLEDLNTF